MGTNSNVKINFSFDCLYIKTLPKINILLDKQLHQTLELSKPTELLIEENLSQGLHSLIVEFTNKNYQETSKDKDMAVLINLVKFQYINYDFKIFGRYFPDYPEPWASQQPCLAKEVYSSYLGWNGKWEMDFEVPIYPWIHKKLQLGWLL